MEIQQILMIVALVLLLAIGMDGWRRMRKQKKSALSTRPLSKSDRAPIKAADLPLSRVRVVATEKTSEMDSVPVLMDTVDEEPPVNSVRAEIQQELDFTQELEQGLNVAEQDASTSVEDKEELVVSPQKKSIEESPSTALEDIEHKDDTVISSLEADEALPEHDDDPFSGYRAHDIGDGLFEEQAAWRQSEDRAYAHADTVISLFVMSDDDSIDGRTLSELLLGMNFRYGDGMQIFHHRDAQGEVDYSLANGFNPGTIDLRDMENFRTSGVTFLMPLPAVCSNPVDAFDQMLSDARYLADQVGARVYNHEQEPLNDMQVRMYRAQVTDSIRQRFQEQ